MLYTSNLFFNPLASFIYGKSKFEIISFKKFTITNNYYHFYYNGKNIALYKTFIFESEIDCSIFMFIYLEYILNKKENKIFISLFKNKDISNIIDYKLIKEYPEKYLYYKDKIKEIIS